jgi:hypothetical protein
LEKNTNKYIYICDSNYGMEGVFFVLRGVHVLLYQFEACSSVAVVLHWIGC